MYSVAKFNPTTIQGATTTLFEAATVKKLFSYLNHPDNSAIYFGGGFFVSKNDKIIANSGNVKRLFNLEAQNHLGNYVKVRPTLKKLLEIADESA